jgi:hypothetical protein
MSRVPPILVICAVVSALCLAGCSLSRPGSENAPEFEISERGPGVDAAWVDRTVAELREERAGLRALLSAADRQTDPETAPVSQAAEEIARAFRESLADWQAYRAELGSARLLTVDKESEPELQGPAASEKTVGSEELLVIQRKYSAARLNAQLRVALLESRIGIESPDSGPLKQKLETARAELKAIEDKCRREMEERTPAGNPADTREVSGPGDMPGSREPQEAPAGDGEDAAILRELCARQTRVPARPAENAIGTLLHARVASTCDALDHTIELLEDSGTGESRTSRSDGQE